MDVNRDEPAGVQRVVVILPLATCGNAATLLYARRGWSGAVGASAAAVAKVYVGGISRGVLSTGKETRKRAVRLNKASLSRMRHQAEETFFV